MKPCLDLILLYFEYLPWHSNYYYGPVNTIKFGYIWLNSSCCSENITEAPLEQCWDHYSLEQSKFWLCATVTCWQQSGLGLINEINAMLICCFTEHWIEIQIKTFNVMHQLCRALGIHMQELALKKMFSLYLWKIDALREFQQCIGSALKDFERNRYHVSKIVLCILDVKNLIIHLQHTNNIMEKSGRKLFSLCS